MRIILILLLFLGYSCQEKKSDNNSISVENNFYEISDLHLEYSADNVSTDSAGNIYSSFNLDNSLQGIEFPESFSIKDDKLLFKFKIKNISGRKAIFNYKVIYQNETYKFDEWDSLGKINPLSTENFYGSWSDSTIHVKNTGEIPYDNKAYTISDEIRIIGNPRFEKQFYTNGINNRWQRNPRVGKYQFYLLIWEKGSDKLIPEYIKNIQMLSDSQFIHPLYYCYSTSTKRPEDFLAIKTKNTLSLKITLNPENGIYIDPTNIKNHPYYILSDTCCGQTESLKRKAHFQQFFHTIVSNTSLDNIPVISDVLNDNYTHLEYNWNKAFFKKEELIQIRPADPKYSCETVKYNPASKSIRISNPKSTYSNLRKENTGIITRHGFTYGKYRVKCKLTELLNKDRMWNGITNAIWLINQSNEKWNGRRPCNKSGYMSSYLGGSTDSRSDVTSYSEIDFEILKSTSYCPSNLFPPVYKRTTANKSNFNNWNKPLPQNIQKLEGSIMVNCTNWDMACADPENFKAGCNPINYLDQVFQAHRWDTTYRATTISTPAEDDQLFASPYYYFEIEWKPTEIIWRIGPSVDKMQVVGYMNSTITSIPNNQMLLIIDQEFHNTKWWIGSPYSQDNIPFPKNDITGDIFEVTLE
ncbi:MAG: hypothetical protein ACKVQV_15025 [Bacteroidia bacterium]